MNKRRAPTADMLNHHRLKRREATAEVHHSLLPGLPDDVANLCLSLVPPSTLYSVCHPWRRLLYSPSFPPFLSLYAVVSSADRSLNHITNPIEVCSFDPISSKWQILPPPPPSDPSPDFLLRHRSYIARNFPIQCLTASGNLVVLAGTNDDFRPALSQPLVLDPLTKVWSHGPTFSAPRRWCAVGAVGGAVHVASGIGASYTQNTARLVERWDMDPRQPRWHRMRSLKDVKFCREAIEAVGWKGKLCMVNVKGYAAKDGTMYDVRTDSWQNMPAGMLAGWKGPAASMAEETMYVVDEKKGWLRKYDESSDAWVMIAESGVLKGAQQVAAAGGRVCVLCADGVRIAVVDVATARLWVVDAPAGIHVLGIHILPRSCV